MPKIRNRNVNTLPHEFAVDKNNLKVGEYFGENIQQIVHSSQDSVFKNTPTLTSESDIDSVTFGFNKLEGLSSSSSLSWSDEYESETSKKIQEELQRMDRILRRQETIPSHYDKDEYEQWMTLFPNLSIFDAVTTPVNSIPDIFEKFKDGLSESYEEANFPEKNYLMPDKSFNVPLINSNVSTSSKLLKQRVKNKQEQNKNNSPFTTYKSTNADKNLKISPLTNSNYGRKLSSKSLLDRQISKEYAESSLEYSSLPFIGINEIPLATQCLRTKDADLSYKKNSCFVLPPLINDKFRSISATPRQAYKPFTVHSMKSNGNTSKCFLGNCIKIKENRYL